MPPREPHRPTIRLEVNGATCEVRVHPMARLLDVLRIDLGLTGTKEGCGEGECGACSVLVDETLVNACLIPVLQVANRRITTIEALAAAGELHPLQAAFIAAGGAQCGICTPGMVMAAYGLLRGEIAPSHERIREALAGNLCRCTGYMKIVEAVELACRTQAEPSVR